MFTIDLNKILSLSLSLSLSLGSTETSQMCIYNDSTLSEASQSQLDIEIICARAIDGHAMQSKKL